MMSDSTNKVSFFKKGKMRPTSTRQRSPAPSSPPGSTSPFKVVSDTTELVIPTRKSTSKLLSQGTKRSRREEDDEDDDNSRVDVNWAGGTSSNVNHALDILEGDEAEALLARKRAKVDNDADEDLVPDDGKYHGQSGYRNHITKSKEIPKAMRVGPQKSSSTIRTVTIVDYQPDVCKDYKGKMAHLLNTLICG